MTTQHGIPAEEPDVIVVGGGIGGLSAAYALRRTGLRVRVLERSAEFGEVGAGLQIAPNCTRILDEYGLLDEAKQLGVLPENMVMKDAVDGSELTRLDLLDLERRYGYPYMVIHRSDLHGILLRACQRAGVDLVTGQRAVGFENTGRGAAVTFAGRPRRGGRRRHGGRRAALGGPAAARRRRAGQQLVRRLPRRGADRAGAGERHLRDRRRASTSAPAATSCSTPCAAARCSTRSPSSSRPRRWPARRTGEPPTSSTPPSRVPASRCSRGCR